LLSPELDYFQEAEEKAQCTSPYIRDFRLVYHISRPFGTRELFKNQDNFIAAYGMFLGRDTIIKVFIIILQNPDSVTKRIERLFNFPQKRCRGIQPPVIQVKSRW